ncbi:hypothetical protein [Cellulomonas sp. URHE0023]|uniref:hypothetical protein n=1 Tax=Cellulomonas sp. URHE0023 TaxID=1380354 RepID=UPI0004870DBD|nr:hypothetical protein [Cellulomonas sp. URHE0023]
MTWLALRQFRTAAYATTAALAVILALLAATGVGLRDRYSVLRPACGGGGPECSAVAQAFFRENRSAWLAATALVLVVPALVGTFWGAPLVAREVETGTHFVAWNQSTTRRHWLLVKLCVLSLAAMLTAALCTAAVSWWSSPLDEVATGDFPLMDPLMFAARGVAPVAYSLFAFVLGVTVGMFVRRTTAAMAATVALLVTAQVLFPVLVRPHVVAPGETTTKISDHRSDGFTVERVGPDSAALLPGSSGAWFLSSTIVDPSGTVVDSIPVSASGPCVSRVNQDRAACLAEMDGLGYRFQVRYQPLSHFWSMQARESAVYVGLSLALAGLCLWRIRRNLG